MQTPLQITFRNIDKSDAVDGHIRERAARLDKMFSHITRCHVALEAAQRHDGRAHHYRARIDIAVPGEELAVSHAPSSKRTYEDLYAAVNAAFDDAERVLEHHDRRRRRRTG